MSTPQLCKTCGRAPSVGSEVCPGCNAAPVNCERCNGTGKRTCPDQIHALADRAPELEQRLRALLAACNHAACETRAETESLTDAEIAARALLAEVEGE